MASSTKSDTGYRARHIPNRNGTFSAYFDRPPAITYSKRVTPLPLKGTHFRRRDPYEIPSDSDDEDTSVEDSTSTRTKQPSPDDPPLSEDELEAVYGRNASPIESVSSILGVSTSKGKAKLARSTREGKGILKKRPVRREVPTQRLVPVISRNEARTFSRKVQTTVKPSKRSGPSIPPRHEKKLTEKAPRRRPVNELLLVPSPAQDHVPRQSSSSPQRPPTQDPIANSSYVSPINEDFGREKAPLTSIRKRLKTPKFTHKSVAALRKKKDKESRAEIGDGFERSELQIDQHFSTSRSRKGSKSLVQGLSALDLKAGPLPDVKFEDSSSVLKLERTFGGDGDTHHNQEVVETTEQELKPETRQQTARKVGFSDRVLEGMVMQQLSSISAPRRVYSISSDHSSEDQDDFEETDEDEEPEDERAAEDVQSQGQSAFEESDDDEEPEGRRRAPTPPSNQHARQRSSFWRRQPSPVTPAPVRNNGVTLDFRKTASITLGQPPTPFGKRKLMEVDDTIYDEPDRPPAPPPASLNVNVEDEEMLDEEEVPQPPPPPPPPPPHPRSILRNHTPRHHPNNIHNARPEHTAANTRRNSMITLADEAESRYFATATDMLRRPSRDHHHPQNPRVLKHRSSQLRRSAYAEVQVLDSESRVLETSPERPDYSNFTNLDVLKRSSDMVWTSSQSLPRAPRDLKSLTRTVSREHGTVSQSLRRRSSLPFQSPAKVRKA
ncbi:hypothetical protein M409DRAFT_27187 [Zasmidium cellare ATCC 36951]|uniref:Uncharacterized protein n=1 Tax=Zasmidium cellare ATCC 36951 TaxID=1080233 RepID=A0A6A6C6B5_ZASCE|nr:uncharacterized protein M409DRAFT_27187 [Zasmidium cellare ATCC 36951]KAF2162565.1 hypothetical protein M409DRAFT_27187 [Zasmidium cellare ATCC 36951]